jgi:Acetyl-CoA hydrolase/transferase C-terminal domain
MAPRRLDPHDIASALPPGGRTLVAGCSGESLLLANAVMRAGDAVGAMTFTGIFVPGLNKLTYVANPECRVETFFLTPELKAAGSAVKSLPLCYADILARLKSVPIDAALFMTTTPDAGGDCGFGPVVDFLAELWPRIPVRIAHINPRLPRVQGPCRIPFGALTAYVEAEQELLGFASGADDAPSRAIGENVARFVGDGATIQMGLGKIPTASLRALKGRRNLKIHSGLIPEAVVDLEDAGALATGVSVTGGVAIGSARLYDRVGSDAYCFHPVSYTHAPRIVAGLEKAVSLNSALEVDLYGQAYAELGPDGLMSGPGGASDFARGVWAGGGLRIVALPASAAKGAVSRVVAPGASSGPVSLGRMDTDIVVTEYGAADLRGLDHHERAAALIAVAAPAHRERLAEAWAAAASKF